MPMSFSHKNEKRFGWPAGLDSLFTFKIDRGHSPLVEYLLAWGGPKFEPQHHWMIKALDQSDTLYFSVTFQVTWALISKVTDHFNK